MRRLIVLRNTRTTDSLRRGGMGEFLARWRRAGAACALFIALAMGAPPLTATQHALLVGISSYASGDRFNLEGPRHDIAAFRRILVERFRLAPDNIHELVDRRATRANILSRLESLVTNLNPRDSLIVYFSGHGTSSFDAGAQFMAAAIGPNSGALVPHDFDPSGGVEAVTKTLIIGRRDLRPLLSRANPQSTVFVILDSCYSGNAAKGAGDGWEGAPRAIQLVKEMADARNRSTNSTTSLAISPTPAGSEVDEYPYSNVIAFSAASKSEPARDIDTRLLRTGQFVTFDGLPHGAFSNALLAALEGPADVNRDGNLTYGELFRFIRQNVHQSHRQTPQVQLPAESMLELTAFTTRVAAVPALKPPATTTSPSVRLAVEGASPDELARLQRVPGVSISTAGHDLLLRRESSAWLVYSRNHALVRRYSDEEFPLLARRIAAQTQVQQIESFQFSGQNFSLSLDAKPVGRTTAAGAPFASRYSIGEEFSIVAGLEKTAFLVLLNIDHAGAISILLPSPKEVQPVPARTPLEILRARASAPAGTEVLRAFAFPQKPAGWDAFACTSTAAGLTCPQFEPGSPEYARLLELLRHAGSANAAASLRLETVD